jgi:D-xylose transport system substrate-binding protein
MRRTSVTIAAVGIAASFALSACSSSGGSSSSSSAGGGGGGNSSPATTSSSSSSGGGGGGGGAQVGVILPDTTSSTRYTLYDQPLLQKAFNAAGIKADIQNANGSTAQQTQIAQSMIGEGIKVLILDSIDQTSGAGVEQAAKSAGVKVIDYDRVNLGGSADYYVSFDNEQVGVLQAQTLLNPCLKSVKDPKIIMMDGGTDVDNNAVLFKAGAHKVLDPLQKQGKLKIVAEQVVKGWDVNLAAPAFTQALTSVGGSADGVVAANDDIANAVIGVLKTKGLAGKTPVTGQDAGVEGLQNILQGYQCMTVFKDVKKEANAAFQLAQALVKGTDPSSAGIKFSPFKDPKNGRNIQAYLLTPQVITINNVEDVVKAGALTAKQICTGAIAKLCSQHGVK